MFTRAYIRRRWKHCFLVTLFFMHLAHRLCQRVGTPIKLLFLTCTVPDSHSLTAILAIIGPKNPPTPHAFGVTEVPYHGSSFPTSRVYWMLQRNRRMQKGECSCIAVVQSIMLQQRTPAKVLRTRSIVTCVRWVVVDTSTCCRCKSHIQTRRCEDSGLRTWCLYFFLPDENPPVQIEWLIVILSTGTLQTTGDWRFGRCDWLSTTSYPLLINTSGTSEEYRHLFSSFPRNIFLWFGNLPVLSALVAELSGESSLMLEVKSWIYGYRHENKYFVSVLSAGASSPHCRALHCSFLLAPYIQKKFEFSSAETCVTSGEQFRSRRLSMDALSLTRGLVQIANACSKFHDEYGTYSKYEPMGMRFPI